MSNSIGALAALIQQPPFFASIAAVIVSVLCASLAWGQRRRLAAMQTQIDSLRRANRGLERAVRRLEGAHQALLLRVMRKPRKAPKSSSSSSVSLEAVEEKTTLSIAPKQADEKHTKGSALYVVAPKTSPE